MLLLIEAAKLFCLDGMDRSTLDSSLLDPRRMLSGSGWSGKAHGKPFVGAAAVGSGMPDTLRGLGLMTGALRGTTCDLRPGVRTPNGERGPTPFGLWSVVIPRCCCRLETSEARDAFSLAYGDDGLICRCPMPTFIRLSTLLRRESRRELASAPVRGSC